MRIVTYNIWNSEINFNKRLELLLSTLKQMDIDILALQEVRDEMIVKRIKDECQFSDYYWEAYTYCDEGLAILSKYPIISFSSNFKQSDNHNSGCMLITININGTKVGITNVHLDYKKSLNREIEIVKAVKKIEEDTATNLNIMLGDFNTHPNSIIHQFLTGRQSLFDVSTSWIDLADAFAAKNNTSPNVTLDFYNNPRFDLEQVLDIPGRFDWILLKNPYPKKYPVLKDLKIIGFNRVEGLTPSDHYGVFCEIEILLVYSMNFKEICLISNDHKIKVKLYRRPENHVIQEISTIVKLLTGKWFTQDVFYDTQKDLLYQDVMCLYQDDVLVSFIIFTCWDGNINITLMGTHPDYQHKGYGSILFNYFCEYLKEYGFFKVILLTVPPEVNQNYDSTVKFYHKLGFKFTKRYTELWQNGALQFVKELD